MQENTIFYKVKNKIQFQRPDLTGFENYNAFNNSIIKSINKEEYVIIFRYSNFTPTRDKKIPVLDSYDSKLGVLKIDKNFKPIGSPFLINGISSHNDADFEFGGYEDPRIFIHDSKYYIIATHHFPNLNINKLFLIQLNNDFDCEKIKEIKSPFTARTEKNWSPFIFDNEIYIKYRLEPNTVLHLDPNSGKTKEIYIENEKIRSDSLFDKNTIAGGTPLINYNEDEYIGICHSSTFDEIDLKKSYFNTGKRISAVEDSELEKHFNSNSIRNFVSYIYTISNEYPFNIIRKSEPIKFVNPDNTYEDIQYVAGICKDFSGNSIILAYGTNDTNMNILKLENYEVEKIINMRASYKDF